MDLLRREWGHMLNTNLSVQLTLLEGFTANGSLGYVYIVLYYEYTDYSICNSYLATVLTTMTSPLQATHTAGVPVQRRH